jgi:dihydrofolate synthase / folylpolyglutamate synthase
MTSYESALEWLYRTQDRGVKLGLDNVRRLLARLGNPQRQLRCIHVAGTNGKGSVCAMLDAVARSGGRRVGLFTSPHLVRYNERIQVDGESISDEAVIRGLAEIRSAIEPQHHPTFFEITTALAFRYFARHKCDLVILETGLGGRLDATNVVDPILSVLTAIDFDHQKWLGNTLPQIAWEKAGIIKPGIPVVSAPQHSEVRAILEEVAGQKQSTLQFVKEPVTGLAVALPGAHQRLNASIALAGLAAARILVSQAAIREGLEQVRWPGRFQRISPGFVLDGAHNPAAIAQLVRTWREYYDRKRPVIIFAALREKAIGDMLTTLNEIAAEILAVPIASRRAASPDEIVRLADPHIEIKPFDSLEAALFETAQRGQLVLATGSLFLVGQLLALFTSAAYQSSQQ